MIIPPSPGKSILQQRRRRQVAVDAHRIEQTLDYQRLRLVLGIEHLHQFFVRIRTRLSVSGPERFSHDSSTSGVGHILLVDPNLYCRFYILAESRTAPPGDFLSCRTAPEYLEAARNVS